MSLGVHFALSSKDLTKVCALTDPEDLLDFISEDLEERYLDTGKWAYESDKAWDAIHRCLTDGQLLYQSGPCPLAYAVLGGRPLNVTDDYTACLVEPEQVRETSAALAGVTREWLHDRYQTLDKTDYAGPIDAEDFEYTWENFAGLRTFFAKAAKAGRAVLFTTDA
jgi:hypothetical protein